MKLTTELLLAVGLAFCVAGCASTGGGGGGAAPGTSANQVASSTQNENMRNFNLRVKCPGVHELKTHGWTDQQIEEQLSVTEEDIPACEQWVQAQPKGYVPPPPAGFKPAAPAPAAPPAAAASPAAAAH